MALMFGARWTCIKLTKSWMSTQRPVWCKFDTLASNLLPWQGSQPQESVLSEGPGTPIQWQKPGTYHEQLEDTWLFGMTLTTWAQKFYLMILKSWESYPWEKWKCGVWPKVCRELDQFLFYLSLINGRRCGGCYIHYAFQVGLSPALTFFAYPNFLNIQNPGQMSPPPGSSQSELVSSWL